MAKRRPISKKTFKPKTFNTNLLDQRRRRLDKLRAQNKEKKKARFKQFIKDIGKILSGKKPPTKTRERKIYIRFWSAVIHSMFTSIYEAYEVKSKGETDDIGNSWSDLSSNTKAYSRNRRGRLTKNQQSKLRGEGPGLLSPRQYKQWKKFFAEKFHKNLRYVKNPTALQIRDSEISAAKYAWWQIKNKGAETLIDVLGKQKYPIMRVTDRLMNSFEPRKLGKDFRTKYKPKNEDQVVEWGVGEVEIGTSVPYAKMAEAAGKKPRELWGKNLKLWYDKAVEAGRDSIAEYIEEIAKSV